MRRERDKYVYVDTPIEKIKIEKFWKRKLTKIRIATETFMFNPSILTSEIQKEFNVYTGNIYLHFYRLKELGLIYIVQESS